MNLKVIIQFFSDHFNNFSSLFLFFFLNKCSPLVSVILNFTIEFLVDFPATFAEKKKEKI